MQGVVDAVWPAVWPAAAMAVYILATRPFLPLNLFAVAVEYGIAVSVYAATFLLFAILPAERQFYIDKIAGLVGVRFVRRVAPVSESA